MCNILGWEKRNLFFFFSRWNKRSISRKELIKQFQIYARWKGDILHSKNLLLFLFSAFSYELQNVKKEILQKEKISSLQFFFDKTKIQMR